MSDRSQTPFLPERKTAPFVSVRGEVERIPPCNAGPTLDEMRNRYGVEKIAKPGSNENPLEPSPHAMYGLGAEGDDYPSAVEMLENGDAPWIVLLTFSKAYGLARFRAGYGVASSGDLAAFLHRVRTPSNANAVAQAAAEAALVDHNHLRRAVELVLAGREWMRRTPKELGYDVAPSKGNFLFFDAGESSDAVAERLLQSGVIVKSWRQAGFETFLRVSVGAPAENDQFLEFVGR